MVCHRLHEIIILRNKSIVATLSCNLIWICEVIAVCSTWLSCFIVAKRWLSCCHLVLSNLLLSDCITIIVHCFHILCNNVIFAWYLNIIRLWNLENIWIQIFISNASWIVSKIVFIHPLNLVLSDWLSMCIITLLSTRMICSSVRIVCWSTCSLLALIVCPIKTIFQIINPVSKILLLWSVVYNVQTYLALMSFILNS